MCWRELKVSLIQSKGFYEDDHILRWADDRNSRRSLAAARAGACPHSTHLMFCRLRADTRRVSDMGCNRSDCTGGWWRYHVLVFHATRALDRASHSEFALPGLLIDIQ